jgi:hypothetical protein
MDETILYSPVSAMVDEVALFGNQTIEFTHPDNRKEIFVPDDTKGFFQFQMAHGFPMGRTAYGTALHPGTTAKSWPSLKYQNLNYEHNIRAYHQGEKNNNVEDRILGTIVAASYPQTPTGGWKVPPINSLGTNMIALNSATPAITGVASFAKLATAMSKVVGDHQTGRHKYSVSMEVRYNLGESGFAVAMKPGGKARSGTPDDLAKAGFEYWPFNDAPEEVMATFSQGKNRIVKDYRGRQASMLMGGLPDNGSVHFCGMGLVKFGAEKPAAITQMAASGLPGLADAMSEIPELLRQALGLSDSDND